jgi:rod shape-determining protein MreC
MQNIINFILRNHYFLLFLLLEFFSFSFIVRSNFYHKSLIFNSSNAVSGFFLETLNSVNNYFYLKEVNRQLSEENAYLKSMHKSSFIFDSRDRFIHKDTIYNRKYSFLPAMVINNSVGSVNNYLTLNVGSNQGVKPGMGVVSPTGVAGIVKQVSPNYSSVYSVLHSETKISAKTGVNEIIGTVIWSGKNYRQAALKDIARHHTIEIGDSVFTSNFSRIFPPGILIGTIENFTINRGYDFYDIVLTLAVDFSRISEVYVIIQHLSEEQLTLEAESQNE